MQQLIPETPLPPFAVFPGSCIHLQARIARAASLFHLVLLDSLDSRTRHSYHECFLLHRRDAVVDGIAFDGLETCTLDHFDDLLFGHFHFAILDGVGFGEFAAVDICNKNTIYFCLTAKCVL